MGRAVSLSSLLEADVPSDAVGPDPSGSAIPLRRLRRQFMRSQKMNCLKFDIEKGNSCLA